MLVVCMCRHITIGVVHGARRPIEGAPTKEELATAMGHAPSTATKHYDRTKPQRDAQRAVEGMRALREAMRAEVVGVGVGEEGGGEVGGGGEQVEYDIEIDLDEE